MISVIIRTKNEERWMRATLERIRRQKTDQPIEVVLVDNQSTDLTVARAKAIYPHLVLVTIDQFLPGLALNLGAQASSGDYIVCLSAHCPPVDDLWLGNLLRNLNESDVAGVYGRQVPTRFTNPFDKRDLLNIFGLDRRVQIRDTFFHNANSMIPRSIWERFPFNESITNIEDRLWGQEVINAGFKIVYEPEASVFHYHGIHQDNRPDRARNVVRILESHIADFNPDQHGSPFDHTKNEVCAIIPMRSSNSDLAFEIQLLERTLHSLQASSYIKRIIIATDNPQLAAVAIELGVEAPFLRPAELSLPNKRVDLVLQYYLNSLEADGYFPDLLLSLSITYPFRPVRLIDDLIERLVEGGFDTVMAGIPEYRSCWQKTDVGYHEVTDSSMARTSRDPLYISVPGLACVCLPNMIRLGNRTGGNVGIYAVNDPLASTEALTAKDYASIRSKMHIRDVSNTDFD